MASCYNLSMSNDTNTISSTEMIKAEVMILWSENRNLASDFACEGKEEVFHDLNKVNRSLRTETMRVVKQNGGYDKTKFVFRVTTKDGEEHRYEGRIDVGSDTNGMFDVVEEHIMSFLDWVLNREEGQYGAPSSEEERNEIILWKTWCRASKRISLEARDWTR